MSVPGVNGQPIGTMSVPGCASGRGRASATQIVVTLGEVAVRPDHRPQRSHTQAVSPRAFLKTVAPFTSGFRPRDFDEDP